MASYVSYRKSKEKALAEMREIQPDTPTVSTSVSDFSWTHGQWREEESSEDEITDKEPQTLDRYNNAMAQIAGLSDIKIPEPLTFVLKKDWASVTETEKQMCEKKVDDACRVVCRVIAPSSSKELLKSYITHTSRSDNEVEALILAYTQAPTKSLKTQILSIYALRFTSRELKGIHAPFENIPYHRVRIDKSKLEHFLSFVNQPYFYQDVSFGTRTVKLDSGQRMVMPK